MAATKNDVDTDKTPDQDKTPVITGVMGTTDSEETIPVTMSGSEIVGLDQHMGEEARKIKEDQLENVRIGDDLQNRILESLVPLKFVVTHDQVGLYPKGSHVDSTTFDIESLTRLVILGAITEEGE
jgi:hypothetical protein